MNVRQLEIFIALMSSRTVSQAAIVLNISQPAVSKSLKIMEMELGITLFQRHRGQFQPSPEAQLLYPRAQKLFKELDSLRRFAGDLQYETSGKITITTSPTVSASFIGAAVKHFIGKRPNVKIEIRTHVTHDVIHLVAGNEVEIGFGTAPAKDFDSRAIALCQMIDLCENEFVLAVPQGHPLAEKNTVRPVDLQEHPMISFPEETQIGSLVKDAFKATGMPHKANIITNQTNSVCYLIKKGVGVALVNPMALNGGEFSGLIIRPFRPRIMVRSCIYTSRFRPLSQLAKEFIRSMHVTGIQSAKDSQFPIKMLLTSQDCPR